MKRAYVTPEVEKIEFQYRDQVVVASGDDCIVTSTAGGENGNECISDQPTYTNQPR